ncbi:hypothetical protein CAPTEDRAFT_187470 [Capitella teleta]|uniref:NR LBD domain-containing protein n=1 Tax=Capitella teleta TaxID=283909 RepID=R7VFD8_CAPTE|nr:hypothetical protein CAPTEDRAFT_212555 [Capitella teleta]ELU17329.1 hypothetical protein CAPTEDRAFT_187470 [Capitella teleta]|eukprot:ELT92706.1 hypothetical protein CAPTEDRAFT_212555 [Capitella teleta]
MDVASSRLLHNDDGEYMDTLFRIMERMHKLELSEEETCLFMGIQLLFTDLCELKAPEKVQKCQDYILELLTHHVRTYYPDEPLRLSRILMIAADLRTVELPIVRADYDMQWAKYIDVDVPDLFYEIWAT